MRSSFRCRRIRRTHASRRTRSDLFGTPIVNPWLVCDASPFIPEARMAKGPAVITGGLVLAATGRVAPSDLLLEDDRIAAIAPSGSVTSASARRIDAAGRLIIPGLINAHTHGHGGLAKGSGDTWSLETAAERRPVDQRRPHRRRSLSVDRARQRWKWCAKAAPPATTCRRCCQCPSLEATAQRVAGLR